VVIAGCGFLGEAAAGFFYGSGWEVLGLCATPESAARAESRMFQVLAADMTGDLAKIPERWLAPDLLIHCASSGRGGADAYRAIYRDGLENALGFFHPGRVIFTSSTSVYAQADGSWVDEDSPTKPGRETGAVLLEAERIALQAGGTVARLSGIYGPGRSVFLRKFLDGSATWEAGAARWVNQIHRDDAARALVRLADGAVVPGVYNVCDSTPATRREVYSWIAAALGKPLPPAGPPEVDGKREQTNKRVRNAKLRATGWQPEFFSYAAAISGILGSPANESFRCSASGKGPAAIGTCGPGSPE